MEGAKTDGERSDSPIQHNRGGNGMVVSVSLLVARCRSGEGMTCQDAERTIEV